MSKLAKVHGEVILRDGKDKYIEPYEDEFALSDNVKTLEEARCIIQNGLMADRLKEKYTNFKSVRTCQVIEFTSSKEVAPNSELDELLLEATRLGCLPDNISNYRRADFKAQALKRAIQAHKDRVEKDKKEK